MTEIAYNCLRFTQCYDFTDATIRLSYTYTTGSSALPDIYARALGPAALGLVRISAMYHVAHAG